MNVNTLNNVNIPMLTSNYSDPIKMRMQLQNALTNDQQWNENILVTAEFVNPKSSGEKRWITKHNYLDLQDDFLYFIFWVFSDVMCRE